MADFCKQCTQEILNIPNHSDLDNLGNGKPPLEAGYGYPALCEGCGPILVNDAGECITEDCLSEGHPNYEPI